MILQDLTLRYRALRLGGIASPSGDWICSRTGTTREWHGYGRVIRIEPQGLGDDWQVWEVLESVDGEPRRERLVRETSQPFTVAEDYMDRVMVAKTGGRAGVNHGGQQAAGRAD